MKNKILQKLSILAMLLASTFSLHAQFFMTGQDATNVVGQANFTTRLSGTTNKKFWYAYDVAVDTTNGKMYVADWWNNRVLRFAYPVTQNEPVADLVFGQSTFTSSTSGTTANTFKDLTGVAVDASGNLWVADGGNHRVLKFNAAYNISTNQPNANVVLGQSNFTTGTSGATLSKMNKPFDLCFDDDGILWVADASNHRVLRFDAANQGTGATANGYLGVGMANVSSSHMNNPERVVCIGTSLFVADRNNHRVLRFDNAATKANAAAADGVLGQANFTTGTQPGVPPTQSGLRSPSGLAKDASGNLYVSNNDINRVMIFYNAVAKANGANADVVLGQSSFTSWNYATTQNGLYNPAGLCFDEANDVLLVSETENHRVVTFIPPPPPATPVANPTPAFSTTYFVAEWNASTGATKYFLDVATDAGFTAFVSGYEDLDVGNVLYFNVTGLTASTNYFYRVRAYNPSGESTSSNTIPVTTIPAPAPFFTNGESPTFVVGQPDLTTITPGASILKMSNTSDVVIDTVHGKMYVADMGNHRVLRYHYPISDDNPQFEMVFGQPDSVTITSGGPAANKFKTPAALTLDASLNLWVADAGNHRVLKFNAPYSISSNQPNADVVIGQPNFTYTITSGTALDKMNYPRGLCFDDAGNLWVADSKNKRVLRFNATNQGTGATADGYLGDLLGSAASSTNFSRPLDVISMGNFIFVADSGLNRVLRFDDAANKPNAPSASVVLGQINFTTNTPGTTQSKFYGPSGLAKDAAGNLYVSDNVNNRTMIFHHVIAKDNGSNADVELGQIDFTGGGAPPLQAAMGYPSGLFFDEKSKVLLVSERYNCRVTLFPINAPEAPVALAATSVSTNYFVAKWALSANANKYYLDVATNNTFTSFVSGFQNLVVSNANYLTITGLAAGTDYFYRVRAANPSGTSQNSNTIQVTTGTFVPCLTNGPMAFRVVGQPDFATTTHGTTSQKLWTPNVVVIDTVHGKMYVAERWINGVGNNRVLRFAYPVTQDYPVAELVFGQPDFTTANPGSCTRSTFNAPRSLAVDASGNLWVADMYNNRVLKFNAAYSQTTNQPDADVVIGHSDFTTQSQMSTATDLDHLRYPQGIAFDPAGNLWIASTEFHRVLRFNADNLHTGATADGFLGTGAAGTMENQFYYPWALAFIGNSLFVLDANNVRVLRFDNAAGKPNAANADGVLGQTTFYSNTGGYTQNKFNSSYAIGTDAHGRLFVTDGGSDYGRVLVFNDALTKANGANADVVIGSTSFTSRDIYPPSPGYLNFSMGVCYDNQNNLLLVSDNSLHRITFFESCATNAVTYDANGGTGDVPDDNNSPYQSGTSVTVLGNVGTPTPLSKTGFVFSGWNTQADGLGTTYQAGNTFTMPASAVTLYAIWTADTYTVTYDANTGSGDEPIDASSPYEVGESVTVLGNVGTPTPLSKTDFNFGGWNTQADGNGTTYQADESFNMPADNVVLYAIWNPNSSAVTYDANGGTGTVPVDANSPYTPGSSVTVLGNIMTPPVTKQYHTFGGWNTQADGNGTTYQADDSFTMPSNAVTLYALWVPDTYTITYDANTGSGNVPVDGSSPYAVGASVTVLGNVGTPVMTKLYHTFGGWNTQADGGGTTYQAGGSFNMPDNNVTLYAIWTADTYTVTYDANTGTGNVPVDANSPYEVGESVTVLGNTGNPALTKQYHTFGGWNTLANGNGTTYQADDSFNMPENNVILYAIWIADTYTVTYDANTGTGNVPVDANSPYEVGESVTVLGNIGTPALTKQYHTFGGWNTQADGNGTPYQAGNSFNMPDNNVVLYAIWTADTYTVTYDANGGTGNAPVDANSPYEVGESVTVLGNVGTPTPLTKTDFNFGGWNTQADGNGTTYQADESFNMPADNVVLYAIWNANSNPVTYHANGGTGTVPEDANSPYTPGSSVTVLGNIMTPPVTKQYHTFGGWNTMANGGGTTYQADDSFTMPANAVTLYALWVPDTYTVTYDANGGTGNPPADGSSPYAVGASVTVLGNVGTPVMTKLFHTFGGWNTQADGNGTTYQAGGSFNMPDNNVVLYAIWKADTYTVTYDANGATGNVPVDASSPYVVGATVNVLGNTGSPALTKQYHTFSGWNTEDDGLGTAYSASDNFNMPDNNVILYAIWTADTYTVTYDANGATGNVPVDLSSPYEVGGTVTVTGNIGTPALTKQYHTFGGWNTMANGGGTTYQSDNSFNMPDNNVTLYAIWTADTYTVTYDANTGTGNVPVDVNSPYEVGESITVLGNVGTPETLTKTDFNFGGWNTQANGGGTTYQADNNFSMPAVNVTLYAIWNCNNPTDGGQIAGNQTICNDNTQPDQDLTELSPPGGTLTGELEYKWQMNAVNPGVEANWSDIPGAVSNTLTADEIGSLTQSTWFRRLVQAVCLTQDDWQVSNELKITVAPIGLAVRVNITASKAPNGQVLFKATPVNGGDNPTYKWFKNGEEIVGVTGDELITTCKSGDMHWVELTSSIPCTEPAKASNSLCTY